MFNKSKQKNHFPSKGWHFFHDLKGIFSSWSRNAKYEYGTYNLQVLSGLDYFMQHKNKETPDPFLHKNLDRVLFDGSASLFHDGGESRFSFVTVDNSRYLVEKNVMPDGRGGTRVSYETAKIDDHYKTLDDFANTAALCSLAAVRRKQYPGTVFIDRMESMDDAFTQNDAAITHAKMSEQTKREVQKFAKEARTALVVVPGSNTLS